MTANLPSSVAILGPGLLGGSIAYALRERSPQTQIRVWARRESAVKDAADKALAHFCSTKVSEVCEGADMVILCTPIAAMPALAHEVVQSKLNKGYIITDVGSVKASIVAQLETVFSDDSSNYVGSHPMAGSESSGLNAARADLFIGAACIITPTLFSTDASLIKTKAFWQHLGAHTLEMTPEEHDRKIARISHLPHLVAAAVTRAALQKDISAKECIGNGFRDATRIASGDPGLWTGIALENRPEILAALKDARDGISDLVAMLEKMDDKALHHFLAEAKNLRDQVS